MIDSWSRISYYWMIFFASSFKILGYLSTEDNIAIIPVTQFVIKILWKIVWRGNPGRLIGKSLIFCDAAEPFEVEDARRIVSISCFFYYSTTLGECSPKRDFCSHFMKVQNGKKNKKHFVHVKKTKKNNNKKPRKLCIFSCAKPSSSDEMYKQSTNKFLFFFNFAHLDFPLTFAGIYRDWEKDQS